MGGFLRQHISVVLLSVFLHGSVLALLVYAERFTVRTPIARQIAIEATVVDESLIQREMERLDRLEQEEVRRQQEQERLARERAEAARSELETEQRRLEAVRQQQQEEQRQRENEARESQLRIADLQRQREQEERLAREEQERRKEAEQERRLEEERIARVRAQEEERRRQEEQEAARQAALEAELQQALAAEDERLHAEEAGLLDEYIRLIENRIQQNWIRPASAVPGLECVVNVTQIPSGDVIDVRIGQCNGDEAVVRSIEAAVIRASPLPRPPVPALFERNLQVVFHPEA